MAYKLLIAVRAGALRDSARAKESAEVDKISNLGTRNGDDPDTRRLAIRDPDGGFVQNDAGQRLRRRIARKKNHV